MKVSLIAYTPEPEKTVAAAAKMCYAAADVDTVMEGLTDEKVANFVDMLSSIGHESPIEHASFTFAIEGVSRALLAQITRHRIASYSVQSQRYVAEKNFEYVLPPEIEKDSKAKEIFLNSMSRAHEDYLKISEILSEKYVEEFLSEGIDEKEAKRKAQKKAIEDARFVLPNACDTKMIATFNARSLQNFFKHRCCNRAQWEIRELATEMLKLVKQVAPNLFKKSGPPCLYGKCPEGKMSCGKMVEVKEKFSNL
ncbi:MAG: FAD-dependent thymidylate synthase [Acutalibacteraceae bacterium]|nr:FAD-dependent thymidylate synthase [Acutalibacteraceae bacterium]